MQIHFLGNAPIGYFKYDYSKPRQSKRGAKVYIMHSLFFSGQPRFSELAQQEGIIDYKWIGRSDFRTYLSKGDPSVCAPISLTD